MRLAEIEKHVASMEELQRIVGAMRAIAGMRMQEAVRALASVREYGNAIGEALEEALDIAGEGAHPAAASTGRRATFCLPVSTGSSADSTDV